MRKKNEVGSQDQIQAKKEFRFLYVTRHFNHSGYLVLKRLISLDIKPIAVVLKKEKSPYLHPIVRPFAIAWYHFKCWYYRCPPLKMLDSEELLAKSNTIPIIETKTMKEDSFVQVISRIQPDLIVLGGGWHELIPEKVFRIPKLGCINTHPSLLPEFRGTSITRWQRLYGISESGVSIHYVNKNFDTGEIIAQRMLKVSKDITPQELFFQLGNLASEMMPDLLLRFSTEGKQSTIRVMNHYQYDRYFHRWKWDIEKLAIDFSKSLKEIHFFISSNTQESYEYLGPICRINGTAFFLRESRLLDFSSDFIQEVNIFDTSAGKVFIKNNFLYLFRENENSILEIKRMQKFNRFYKLHRSDTPDKFIKQNEPIKKIEAL